MIVIAFIPKYENSTYYEYLFTDLGCLNLIFPNVPFHKTWLICNFVKWSTSEMYQFVIKNAKNDSLEDMCIRLYCYLHREIHHKSEINGHCADYVCWRMQYDFLLLSNSEKLLHIYKLM